MPGNIFANIHPPDHQPTLAACPLDLPQLLACLRVIVATADELQAVRQRTVDPLAGPLNPENEEQALQTLRAALDGMLGPLLRLPLLADGQQAEREGEPQQQAEREGEPQQQAEQEGEQPDEPRQQAGGCNENGFDADWRMSRHFCGVYLEGQAAILRRSLRECAELLAALHV